MRWYVGTMIWIDSFALICDLCYKSCIWVSPVGHNLESAIWKSHRIGTLHHTIFILCLRFLILSARVLVGNSIRVLIWSWWGIICGWWWCIGTFDRGRGSIGTWSGKRGSIWTRGMMRRSPRKRSSMRRYS